MEMVLHHWTPVRTPVTPAPSQLQPFPSPRILSITWPVIPMLTAGGGISLTIETDEELTHTSLIINAESGVHCFLKPEAMSSISALLDLVLPQSPDELLDLLQVQVMSQLLGFEERKKGAGNALEVALRVPHVGVRLLNAFDAAEVGPSSGIDQYDLDISNVALTLRNSKQPATRKGAVSDSVMVHCAAESLVININEQDQKHGPQKLGFSIQLDDVLLWLTMSSKNSVHVSFRSLDLEAASKQIEVLAALIHRTFVLVDASVLKLSTILQAFNDRLRYLVYSLTMSGTSSPDPPFLNRTGIALRIAPHHMRNHDSCSKSFPPSTMVQEHYLLWPSFPAPCNTGP